MVHDKVPAPDMPAAIKEGERRRAWLDRFELGVTICGEADASALADFADAIMAEPWDAAIQIAAKLHRERARAFSSIKHPRPTPAEIAEAIIADARAIRSRADAPAAVTADADSVDMRGRPVKKP